MGSPKHLYLVLYNTLAALGWCYVLSLLLFHEYEAMRAPASASALFSRIGAVTRVVQTSAALEIMHALLRWVRSPLLTTTAQVFSRLFLVWGIVGPFQQTHSSPLYGSMVFAWSMTEVIRYSFYAFNLVGREYHALTYLRYTTFFVLYPLGASSEALLISATLPPARLWGVFEGFRAILFVLWWPGLYIMYKHMITQRRKVLGSGTFQKRDKSK
ncbi:PTPLA-domain-containing protein [Pluteus cervinus]|uniref:PTPLA-domain-containing protein n=1 Tax=Pluteus cervinus TaxID=181527 RepID=A0ACD3ASM3_9AGAR|nr:PTPLA-domain-containing protein [Pluteus cervinus]